MVFLPPAPDLALYLNGLSLLFNVYVSQKPGVAAKLGELIEELRALKPSAQSQTRSDLEKRLEEKLLPAIGQVETDAVKRDLDLVTVFAEPIRVEDFDYLSTLFSYGSKYAALADKAALFDLRGATKNGESKLLLPTAGSEILSAKDSEMLLCQSTWPHYLAPLEVVYFDAVLTKTGADFGLRFSVLGKFKSQDRMQYGSRDVELACDYSLAAEDRKNWIRLEPLGSQQGFQWLSRRLEASDVLKFMQAVRADVMKYVMELREEKALIRGNISSLLQEVTQFFAIENAS